MFHIFQLINEDTESYMATINPKLSATSACLFAIAPLPAFSKFHTLNNPSCVNAKLCVFFPCGVWHLLFSLRWRGWQSRWALSIHGNWSALLWRVSLTTSEIKALKSTLEIYVRENFSSISFSLPNCQSGLFCCRSTSYWFKEGNVF